MALTSDAVFHANANVPFPSGYSKPTTAISQTDPLTVKDAVYNMPRANGTSTTSALGIAALVTAFETWLSGTFIPTTMGIDVLNTVTAIATITKITNGDSGDDIFLDDATATLDITFDCTIEVS